MKPDQLGNLIILPAIQALGAEFAGRNAGILLLATSAQESHCGEYVHQVGGPALGPFQMEPPTHDDVWSRAAWKLGIGIKNHNADRMVYDFRYATQLARLKYYLDPAPVPEIDRDAMWAYYKRVYNTPGGAATQDQWNANWAQYVAPVIGG